MLGSSVDATKISLTIKAILALVVTILVGFGFNQIELQGLVDQIVNLVVLVIEAVSLVFAIYGGIRRVINQYKK